MPSSFPLALLFACGPDPSEPAAPEAEDTGEPMALLFSFAVFADPHLTAGDSDHEERLAAAVEYVNQEVADRGIALVFVVGDIGWSGGLELAKAQLDLLEVPYAPVIGDNEVYFGDAETFDEVFEPQYALLAQTFSDWRRGEVEVWDPERAETLWLQNFSFTYEGIRFVGLDWCSRDDEALVSELATLHDVDGGTFPYFEEEISTLPSGPEENVLMFSHHPMFFFPGAFVEDDWDRILGVTSPASIRIAGSYAGHFHLDYEESLDEAGYDVYITDATWDDEVTVRLVAVWGNGERFRYEQDLVVVQ